MSTNKIGNTATTATTGGPSGLIVKYHGVPVVAVVGDVVTLNSGGWKTATTRRRINQASRQFDLGFHIWQAQGEWGVRRANGELLMYQDGMTFPALRGLTDHDKHGKTANHHKGSI